MSKESEALQEKEKLMHLLGIKQQDHDSLVNEYQQKQRKLYAQLKAATDIKERIKLQNILLELDDAFLEYQSSMHRKHL